MKLKPSLREIGRIDEVAEGGVLLFDEGFVLFWSGVCVWVNRPPVTGEVCVGPL
jgi:hypothetical protein